MQYVSPVCPTDLPLIFCPTYTFSHCATSVGDAVSVKNCRNSRSVVNDYSVSLYFVNFISWGRVGAASQHWNIGLTPRILAESLRMRGTLLVL